MVLGLSSYPGLRFVRRPGGDRRIGRCRRSVPVRSGDVSDFQRPKRPTRPKPAGPYQSRRATQSREIREALFACLPATTPYQPIARAYNCGSFAIQRRVERYEAIDDLVSTSGMRRMLPWSQWRRFSYNRGPRCVSSESASSTLVGPSGSVGKRWRIASQRATRRRAWLRGGFNGCLIGGRSGRLRHHGPLVAS
jgi:hypothetical protein